jgi:hypothetical protein
MIWDIVGIRNIVPIFQIFSGKISVTALTPLLDPPKNPYLRGDTGGGTPHTPMVGGGTPMVVGGLPQNVPIIGRPKTNPLFRMKINYIISCISYYLLLILITQTRGRVTEQNTEYGYRKGVPRNERV